MLLKDNNKYIIKLYSKSFELNRYKHQCCYYSDLNKNIEINQEKEQNEEIEEIVENADNKWERIGYKCQSEANQYCKCFYKEIKQQKAHDVYIFEYIQNKKQKILTHQENFIVYTRKQILREVIYKVMEYQEVNNLVDYHPNINDLSGEIQEIVNQNMKQQYGRSQRNEEKQIEENLNTPDIVKIRNIIHQSLQPYNKIYCNSQKEEEIQKYYERCTSNKDLDQWGKNNRVSPSQFLWLPTTFIFSQTKNMYEIQGKLFNPLECCPQLPMLKEELGHLMTYFSNSLKEVHEYFKSLDYDVFHDIQEFNHKNKIVDDKKSVDFSERIHAIVKISEMEIQPGCTYAGQWHVEGFSSDNILYTCLYVIEHDENLVDGKLKFKRTPRSDDLPNHPYNHQQSFHCYCPDYTFLCDPSKVIPLGSLDLKEDLMIIFPNQNIHKVKGIKNTTDKPLKRKIIAFFVVNHVDQPFTINDVEFTKPIEVIKENRLRDMYERSKNKQTESQEFDYFEH